MDELETVLILSAEMEAFGNRWRTRDTSKFLKSRLARMLILATFLTIASRLCGQALQQPKDMGPAASSPPPWQYGGFIDVGYLHDFNDPANYLFRSRGTTARVNELNLNMTGLYLKKVPSESSRWGIDLTWQAGSDSEGFGFSATAPEL